LKYLPPIDDMQIALIQFRDQEETIDNLFFSFYDIPFWDQLRDIVESLRN
jgi:hypothetical protein